METKHKKKIFILILNVIFGDETSDINEYNCISFYHFLVDTLFEEIVQIESELEDDICLCDSIIDLLCNFDIMTDDLEDWSEDSIIEFLKDYSMLDGDRFDESISKFRKIYKFIKEDFFLRLI